MLVIVGIFRPDAAIPSRARVMGSVDTVGTLGTMNSNSRPAGRPVRFDWAKLFARTERTADGYPFSSWDVLTDRVRLVYLPNEGRWEYRRWKQRKRTPKRSRPLCAAKTRQGTPCRARCVAGGNRCRLHGCG